MRCQRKQRGQRLRGQDGKLPQPQEAGLDHDRYHVHKKETDKQDRQEVTVTVTFDYSNLISLPLSPSGHQILRHSFKEFIIVTIWQIDSNANLRTGR